MKNSVHSLLGNYYPFFLNNTSFKESYIYQLYSPRLNDRLAPVVSLTKVSEKTTKGLPEGSDLDLIRVCLGKRDITGQEIIEFVEGLTRREWEGGIEFDEGNDKFPCVKYTSTQVNQKLLVTAIRDALRWKMYRFYPGKLVDILWTKNEFTLFEICEDETHYYLKHLGVLYKNTDCGLLEPKEFILNEGFETARWEKSKPTKAIEMNKYFKSLDWASFSRRPIFK